MRAKRAKINRGRNFPCTSILASWLLLTMLFTILNIHQDFCTILVRNHCVHVVVNQHEIKNINLPFGDETYDDNH